MTARKTRPGDIRLPFDPAATPPDAGLVFIGRIRSPWTDLDSCPKNLRAARERLGQGHWLGQGGGPAWVDLDPPWRPGLMGLSAPCPLVLLYWMGQAPRDLIVQAPPHRPAPAGTFALRSPARPNPIALATVTALEIDAGAGRIRIDAIDCLDGTPLLDLKPWLPGVDVAPA